MMITVQTAGDISELRKHEVRSNSRHYYNVCGIVREQTVSFKGQAGSIRIPPALVLYLSMQKGCQ